MTHFLGEFLDPSLTHLLLGLLYEGEYVAHAQNTRGQPVGVELLQGFGSPFRCLATHFRDTGDYCPGSGVPPFDEATVYEAGGAPEL